MRIRFERTYKNPVCPNWKWMYPVSDVNDPKQFIVLTAMQALNMDSYIVLHCELDGGIQQISGIKVYEPGISLAHVKKDQQTLHLNRDHNLIKLDSDEPS